MRYLLLIAGEENTTAPDTAVTNEYMEWSKEAAERGILQGGERLRPTADATTVRVRNGETLTTDGPFAETKEQLLGFYIMDFADEAGAIAAARELRKANPSAVYEIRPIKLFQPANGFGATPAKT